MRRKEEGQRRPVVRVPTFSTDESTSVCDLASSPAVEATSAAGSGHQMGETPEFKTGRAQGTNQGLVLVSLDCRGVPTCRELGCCSAGVV